MGRFCAEWEEQGGVLVAFPHKYSDWNAYLSEAQGVFAAIIFAITQYEKCLVLVHPCFCESIEMQSSESLKSEAIREVLEILQSCWRSKAKKSVSKSLSNLRWAVIPTNDTWARDFSGICVETTHKGKKYPVILDFGFNGWGLKFASNHDNVVTRKLAKLGFFKKVKTQGMILEGGSIEGNGAGLLLTTTKCLLESINADFTSKLVKANRNPHLTQEKIELKLKKSLGVESILWLHHGYLRGDDTDSHIDTLARFVNKKCIVYVKCTDRDDEHFRELELMEGELKHYANLHHLELVPLPMAKPLYYNNERLPASYANFLILNGAILLPAYGDEEGDREALDIMQSVCPRHKVIPINCEVLVREHGSLHCVTMQFKKGFISLV